MADNNRIEKDMPLKTKLMGFDKKSVMDFIEEIQKENQKLKRIVVSLGTENESLKEQIESLSKQNEELNKLISYSSDGFVDVTDNEFYNEGPQPRVTYEDISPRHFEEETVVSQTTTKTPVAKQTVQKETVQAAVPKTRKKTNISAKKAPSKVKLQKR